MNPEPFYVMPESQPAPGSPSTDYDPGFKLAEAGLVVDAARLEQVRVAKRWSRTRVAMEAGCTVGRNGKDTGPGGSDLWWKAMHGRIKTLAPLMKLARALDLTIDEVVVYVGDKSDA